MTTKTGRAALAAMIAAGLLVAAEAAPARKKPTEQTAAQSREEIYKKCLAEAFRKFGWYYGARRVLYADFAVSQADYCVQNGGHF